MSAWLRIFAAFVIATTFCVGSAAGVADVGLLIYPTKPVLFRYDPTVYEIKQPADPGFDPTYSVAGNMLWNKPESRVALEVYRALWLRGFEVSATGSNEFYMAGNSANVCVDGLSKYPRQLNDICVEFQPLPVNSRPDIFVDDVPVVGLRYYIPRLVVSTPVGGGFYADTVMFRVRWIGAQYVRMIVYADKDGDRVFDGGSPYSFLMEDLTVPTQTRTWGEIKSLYGDR